MPTPNTITVYNKLTTYDTVMIEKRNQIYHLESTYGNIF